MIPSAKVLVFLIVVCSAVGFAPSVSKLSSNRQMTTTVDASQLRASRSDNHESLLRQSKGVFAAVAAFLPVGAAVAVEELEIAELPPPYVPALFGVALLAGVGLLTSSLGNVMDEESSLGMQSGARAKKERDRSRSSYFKK